MRAVVAFSALAILAGCKGTSEPRPQMPADVHDADASSAVPGAAHGPLDAPVLRVVLSEPRFAAASELEYAHQYAAAAKALQDARAGVTTVEAYAIDYVVGRLQAAAGDDEAAATAFDASAAVSTSPIVDYARLRAAQAWERRGNAAEALKRVEAVDESIALADDRTLLRAEALSAQGNVAAALPLWRDALTKKPRGIRWVDTSVRLATALLDGADGDAKAHAKEAFERILRVLVEAPSFEESSGALALRDRARALDASLPASLTPDERTRRAQAWLDASKPDKARVEADGALAASPKGPSEAACKAASVRAQATARAKGPVLDAWTEAIARCEGQGELLATALYSAAKASASAKKIPEAIALYAKVEAQFPKHRLADDARFQGALLVRDQGDSATFEKMLLTLPDDYADGDMRGEALFRAALAHMIRADWAGAKPMLDRGEQVDADGHHWAWAARAAYFRARASEETGDPADAKKRYASIVDRFPLAYYMALAYARLEALDKPLAEETLKAAEGREAEGTILTQERPELGTSAFRRAAGLLEVGEIDAAKKELLAAGVLADAADPELVWTAASMFDRARAPDVGHAFTRQRLTSHLSHYPVGRWRNAWEAAFPRAFEPLVVREASAHAISPALVWGIMREESSFIADIRSPSNAFGLMQVLPSTAKEVARGTTTPFDEASLKTPGPSVFLGAKLLGSLRATFPQNPALAIPSYNAGAGAVRGWLAARGTERFDLFVEEIPYEETRGYIKRVLGSELAYAYLYAKDALPELLHLPRRADGAP